MLRGALLAVGLVVVTLMTPANAFASSVSVVVENGIGQLAYYANPNEANDVEIANSARTMTITDAGATISAGSGCTQVGDHEVSCFPVDRADFVLADLDDKATVTEGDDIQLLGGSEADELSICASCHATLMGGPGSDTLVGADSGGWLFGETGNDTITGGSARDHILGGAGSDTLSGNGGRDLIEPSSGNDTVHGGRGRDQVALPAPGPVNVDLGTGTITGWGTKTVTKMEDVIGSRFADELRGDGGSNSLRGAGGADVIAGAGADDVLNGGAGKDRLFGLRGNDRLIARDGQRELVNGGRGNDKAHVDSSDVLRSIESLF
jgi:Ca2+-binding RTX toxin-like protein